MRRVHIRKPKYIYLFLRDIVQKVIGFNLNSYLLNTKVISKKVTLSESASLYNIPNCIVPKTLLSKNAPGA